MKQFLENADMIITIPGTMTDQLLTAKNKLKYVNGIIEAGGLTKWELKEYTILQTEYTKEVADLEIYIKENKLT